MERKAWRERAGGDMAAMIDFCIVACSKFDSKLIEPHTHTRTIKRRLMVDCTSLQVLGTSRLADGLLIDYHQNSAFNRAGSSSLRMSVI